MDKQRRREFSGRVVEVSVGPITLPNGHSYESELVHHPGGAVIAAVDHKHRVCMLRQFRAVAGGWLWELPAGKRTGNEPPIATARRELHEETGLSARHWSPLGSLYSSPGIFTEILYLYLARDLFQGTPRPEAEELLEVHWLPLHEAARHALGGQYKDAKTVVGLLRAAAVYGLVPPSAEAAPHHRDSDPAP